MQRIWKQSALSIIILVAAILALGLLAVLQYSWVGQVSEGERERMRASLGTGAARFSEDFDRELARAYLTFQMDAATLRDRNWERYAQRYDHWASTAPYAALIDSIYLVQINDRGSMSMERYNGVSRRFETMSWPTHLLGVRQRFASMLRSTRVEAGIMVSELPEAVAAEVPALIVPLSRTYLLSDPQEVDVEARFLFGSTILRRADRVCIDCELPSSGGTLFAFTIIALNQHYLTTEFLPALAGQYFGSGPSGYSLTVVQRDDPARLVYQSDPPGRGGVATSGDAQIDILNVKLDELNRFLLNDSLKLDDLDGKAGRSPAITIGVLGQNSSTAQPATGGLHGNPVGAWQAIITHRAGSLDAAVAGLRNRNLILSFSTLLLLAGSIGLILLATRRAQRLAQQKMDFVTTVSHELRTPLAVIRSAGENLADGIIHDPQQARQYGAVIRNEGQRLTEMVDQVMEFAGIQSGRKSYDLAPTDVAEVVARALAVCQMQLSMNGFTVVEAIEPELPVVLCDLVAMRNALQNLIGNAIKYSSNECWIKVAAQLAIGPRGPEVQISVADRGIGIPPGDLPYIFEPFYRGREVVAAQIHGSGLGLGLVKHVVLAHGGQVSVESTPGKGSCFTMHLPALVLPNNQRQVVPA